MRKRLLLAGATMAMLGSGAGATPGVGFSAVQQWKSVYQPFNVQGSDGRVTVQLKAKDPVDLYVTRNAIAPGGQSGWHSHPGPSFVSVTLGAVKVYDGSDPVCPWKVYAAGEGFIDEGGDHSHNVTNASAESAAETVATQLLPLGATRRLDRPKPTNCPF